uniref:Uncharacterized protein n=1 Tax=Lepeophtheirus salmonis TaxID=72036 RepID=A0A0K2U788_LEPSM
MNKNTILLSILFWQLQKKIKKIGFVYVFIGGNDLRVNSIENIFNCIVVRNHIFM